MLDTYTSPDGNRFGAFIFNDTIRVNITVDWDWVSENVDFLLANYDSIIAIGDGLGLISGNSSNILDNVLQDFNFDVGSLFPNIGNNLTGDDISGAVVDFVEGIFGNQSSVTLGNTTITEDDILEFLDRVFNSTAFTNATAGGISINVTTIDGTISFDSIGVVNGTIVISGATLTINGVTLELGDITLTTEQIQTALPDGTITYSLLVPAEYTVMHNSSSPHGVGAFIEELTTSAFKVRLGLLLTFCSIHLQISLTFLSLSLAC